jgi:hypothetical protein
MKLPIPKAPTCSVHGVECYVVEADIVNQQTKRLIHSHDEQEPKRYVCPSACKVCEKAAKDKKESKGGKGGKS